MTQESSSIEELFTDSGAFDTQRVVTMLKSILSIQREGNAIFFTKDGNAMNNEDKILAYFLVKKLLKSEGVIEESGSSGKEVRDKTDLKKGSVDSTIKKLKEKGLLAGKGRNYEIPAPRVEEVLERIQEYSSKTK